MRKTIFDIVEPSGDGCKLSGAYDLLMITLIVLSLIPLAFKTDNMFFTVSDIVTATIFSVDYILRWVTFDYKTKERSIITFVRYPFTPMAIIDLMSILPSVIVINNGLKVLRVIRMIRAMRVFRIFKAARYSKSLRIIAAVLRSSKESLIAVCSLSIAYVLISALVIFNVEPESFSTFFDAVYWATVSLTTVGYGDIYPVSTMGRVITMVSSVFGIAIVALPAGIITAGYVSELEKQQSGKE